MQEGWKDVVRTYRIRHGLSQQRMAAVMGVSQRTVSRWERGEDQPGIRQQKLLRDLGWEPPTPLLRTLAASVAHCPVPRALSRTPRLQLLALSPAALAKRPSLAGWIGRDLAAVATGVLKEMLDDRILQRAIWRREIAGVVATTHGVLDTPDGPALGAFRTTITYFHQDRMLYSDAISQACGLDQACGYFAIAMDEVPVDHPGTRPPGLRLD